MPVKERPILYKGSMVRAIMKAFKTKTRRTTGLEKFNESPDDWELSVSNGDVKLVNKKSKYAEFLVCPFGGVGDVLWVKETFKVKEGNQGILYAADYDDLSFVKWTSPLFMKKQYCRLKLEIVSVKLEQLLDITDEECLLEGVKFDKDSGYYFVGPDIMQQTAFEAFGELWIKINGIESWESNPWVWVIEFKKV